jgi:hypothetical protein
MEKLGFKPIDSTKVTHKFKHIGRCFTIHLMWLPAAKNSKPPTWNKPKLLEGSHFCTAHPLYHPEKEKHPKILQTHDPTRA